MSLQLYKHVLVDADPKYFKEVLFTKQHLVSSLISLSLFVSQQQLQQQQQQQKSMAYLKHIWWGDVKSFLFLIIYFFLEKIHYLTVSCKMYDI